MSGLLTLGVDVGGTTIKSALVDPGGGASDVHRTDTPRNDHSGTATAAIVVGLVKRHSERAAFAGVGLVVPGVVDDEAGVVVTAINLGWADVPLRALVQGSIEVPLTFGQDVRAGAFAEVAASDRTASMSGVSVFIAIGTGIAAAIVVDGEPMVSGGWAGEIGQVAVPQTPSRAGILSPTLERVASATAIARRLGCQDARAVADLVALGDPRASAIWADAIDAIADGLAWTTGVVGAERIIVGGGLAESGELLLAPLRVALDARLGPLRRPEVTGARWGDRAAMIGAGLMAHGAAVSK